jgi:hypothetical protein
VTEPFESKYKITPCFFNGKIEKNVPLTKLNMYFGCESPIEKELKSVLLRN